MGRGKGLTIYPLSFTGKEKGGYGYQKWDRFRRSQAESPKPFIRKGVMRNDKRGSFPSY